MRRKTMQHDKVGSVMTMDVVRALYDTSFEEVARLPAEHRTGGLPVVDDDDRVIGVVTASCLVGRRAAAPAPHRTRRSPGFRRLSPVRGRAAATGLTAGRLMSAPPVTAYAEDTIVEAARTVARRGVKRPPLAAVGRRTAARRGRRPAAQTVRGGGPSCRRTCSSPTGRRTDRPRRSPKPSPRSCAGRG
ncbi:CBS domain-containing protein [Streptomyces paradoxus]|uniref:CBS domain-containing protein n=1 Tax=Streptomyces paradoxus TaxID=66375 RepID=UPI00380138B0